MNLNNPDGTPYRSRYKLNPNYVYPVNPDGTIGPPLAARRTASRTAAAKPAPAPPPPPKDYSRYYDALASTLLRYPEAQEALSRALEPLSDDEIP